MADAAPREIVRAFLGAWPNGVAALRQSFRDHLADDVDYENVGLTHSRGLAEALGLIENFMPGLDWIDVDILSIAEDGDKVLTERVDGRVVNTYLPSLMMSTRKIVSGA